MKSIISFPSTLLASMVLLLAGLSSCYPGTISTSEVDIVATDYDDDYFARKAPLTYFLPDTIAKIGDEDPENIQLTRAQMDFILAQVERNFNSLGYTRLTSVDDQNVPDVVVIVSALIVKYTSAGGGGCYPGWGWGGWYPWYPGWGWPGYCYPVYIYSYDTGTLTIEMIAPDEEKPGEDVVPRVWIAGINGLLRSSTAGNQDFVKRRIDDAFDQSPYLEP